MIARWSALALVATGSLLAQVGEISVSAGVSRMGGANIGTVAQTARDFYKLTDGFRLGFRFTLNPKEYFGHEFGYAYNRSKLKLESTQAADEVSMPVHQGFYNFLVYVTPEGSPVRPFVTGGGHFSSFFPPGASVYYGNQETKFGVNYGAGIKAKVADIWGLRFDVRQYLTPKPLGDFLFNQEGWLKQLEVSAGVAFMF